MPSSAPYVQPHGPWCEECRHWRERHGRDWCEEGASGYLTVSGAWRCSEFERRRGERWGDLLYGNTDTRGNHV